MSAVTESLGNLNPVLDRELRQRSRSGRSLLVMTLLLVVLGGVLYLAYVAVTAQIDSNFGDPLSVLSNSPGAMLYEWVLFAELALLLLIIPGVSASAISGERDRQTLVPLQVTLMGRFAIFVGKVAASSAFVLLLLVASAPLLAVPFLIGGIGLGRILGGFAVALITGVLYATLGVACSAVFRRTQTAVLMTYVLVFVAILGTGAVVVAMAVVKSAQGDFSDPSLLPLYLNPFVGVADAAGQFDRGFSFSGPFSPIKSGMWDADRNTVLPGWLLSLAAQAVLTAGWVALALRKLQLPQAEVD